MALRRALAVAVACAGLAACGDEPQLPPAAQASVRVDDAPQAAAFDLVAAGDGFVRPVHVSSAPGDDALWVLEQTGRLVRVEDGAQRTVLDLSSAVKVGSEQGALGLAFHPGFDRNRRLFVNFTNRAGDTRVAEFRVGADGRARPRRTLLRVAQPEPNHNGGALLFGPDGRLYVGMGDGGGAFDRDDRAQDRGSRLGKVLAADVDSGGAPAWQTVLTGLRNPWRMWFDPALGELWIADVGQDEREEVDRLRPAGDGPPQNLGWPAYEGTLPHDGRDLDRSGELVWPAAEYGHDAGCSVTGGLIYRGTAVPALAGRYVFGDFCSGTLWSVRPEPAGTVTAPRRERSVVPQLTHIGTDAAGELVMATGDGRILRAVPAAP